MIMITEDGSSKIVNFMTPQVTVKALELLVYVQLYEYMSFTFAIDYPCYGMVSPTTTITDEDTTSPSNETNAEKDFTIM